MFSEGELQGHRILYLENQHLKVSILPGKGADIYEFIHQPSGIDFLMKTPAGLRPPASAEMTDFLENYEGGWQELFPNPGEAYQYRGVEIPFHGEAALLPWDYTLERDDDTETTLRLSVHCRKTPFKLERLMRLLEGLPALEIVGKVTNLSDSAEYFAWGHHVVLGGDFLEAGCRLDVPAHTIVTPDELYEPASARLAAGQRRPWPIALGRQAGEQFDLRHIPGPEVHAHDDVYLLGLSKGKAQVSNPRLGLSFWLEWEVNIFRCLVNWQPLGGAEQPPLTGIYGLGIEPWVSHLSLAQAIEKGEALQLAPGASLATRLFAGVTSICPAC